MRICALSSSVAKIILRCTVSKISKSSTVRCNRSLRVNPQKKKYLNSATDTSLGGESAVSVNDIW